MNRPTLNVKIANQQIVPQTVQSFNQHKFVSDIYECEKTLQILNKRIPILNQKIKVLSNSRPQFKKSTFYKNYINECEKTSPPEDIEDYYKFKYDVDRFERKHATIAQATKWTFDCQKLHFIIPGLVLFVFVYLLAQNLFLSITAGTILDIVIFIGLSTKTYYQLEKEYCLLYEKLIEEYNHAKDAISKNNDIYNYWKEQYDNFSKTKNAEIERSIEICNNELAFLKKETQSTEDTLNMLYNLRIDDVLCLHPNYRGLVPISIIYGYFDTGRCFQLHGHEGAYNLYEDEKMKGIIINKLDTVSRQLGKLNSSMYYVGQAIEECNNRLSDLEVTSSKMIDSVNNVNNNIENRLTGVSNQMAAIEDSTANGAYYAEVGAKMTTFNTVYNLIKD